jgi:hypothetical protein
VIGRLPGETSCLTMPWAVMDLVIAGSRGLGLTLPDRHAIAILVAAQGGLADGGADRLTYRERYERTKRRLGRQRESKVARVEIARELSTAIWHMLTRNEPVAPAAPLPVWSPDDPHLRWAAGASDATLSPSMTR